MSLTYYAKFSRKYIYFSDTKSITDRWRVLWAHDLVSQYNSIVALLGADMQLSVSSRFAASGHYYTNCSWKLQHSATSYAILQELGDFYILDLRSSTVRTVKHDIRSPIVFTILLNYYNRIPLTCFYCCEKCVYVYLWSPICLQLLAMPNFPHPRLMGMTMYLESYKNKTRHFTISAVIIVSIELIPGAALALISDRSTTQATYKLWSAEAKECKTSHFSADFLPPWVIFSFDSVFTSHKNSTLKKRVVIVARGFNIRRIDLYA